MHAASLQIATRREALTGAQARFAALVAGGGRTLRQAVREALGGQADGLAPATLTHKAWRWLRLQTVRDEIDRVARQSAVPDSLLAAVARRKLLALMENPDPNVRLQACNLALRLSKAVPPNPFLGPSFHLHVGQTALGPASPSSPEDLDRQVRAALARRDSSARADPLSEDVDADAAVDPRLPSGPASC